MSLVKVSLKLGKTVVVIYPTKRIAKEIETKVSQLLPGLQPRIAVIWPNSELCRKCDPKLPLKFQLKKDCSICEHSGRSEDCPFQRLILNDFNLILLTYDKLRALLASSSPESAKLLKKLQEYDVFIFDEYQSALGRGIQTIEIVTPDENGNVTRMNDRLKTHF